MVETPPRVWGKLYGAGSYIFNKRNTPTCVGKTLLDDVELTASKKHPHVCGENGNYTASIF